MALKSLATNDHCHFSPRELNRFIPTHATCWGSHRCYTRGYTKNTGAPIPEYTKVPASPVPCLWLWSTAEGKNVGSLTRAPLRNTCCCWLLAVTRRPSSINATGSMLGKGSLGTSGWRDAAVNGPLLLWAVTASAATLSSPSLSPTPPWCLLTCNQGFTRAGTSPFCSSCSCQQFSCFSLSN